jgi:hypothetical protein
MVRKRYLNQSPDCFLTFLDLVKRVYNPNCGIKLGQEDPKPVDTSASLFSSDEEMQD